MRKHPAWFDTRRLTFRFYSLLGAAVLLLLVLALAGSHLAHRTMSAAAKLSQDGLGGIGHVIELQALLKRHQRLITDISTARNPNLVSATNGSLHDIEVRALALVSRAALTGEIERLVATLFARGADVDNLIEAHTTSANGNAFEAYLSQAITMEAVLAAEQKKRAAASKSLVDGLTLEASRLEVLAIGVLIVGLVVIGPLGLILFSDAIRRLRAVWCTLHQLASIDTPAPVPSLLDADEIGEMARTVQVFRDNALALSRNRNEVEQVNRWLDIALNNMARGISMFDSDQKLVLCNDMYRAMYALPDALTRQGTPATDILEHRKSRIVRVEYETPDTTPGATVTTAAERHAPPLVRPVDGEDSRAPLERFIAGGQMFSIYQYFDDGRIIALANKRLADGSWVAVHEDVTRDRQAEERIAVLAQTDALTGLANRRAFRDDLDRRCAAPGGPKDFAVHLIDLDEFKPVNDTYGHLAGDAVLAEVAKRLQGLVRDGDLVARVGGDEFAIIEIGAATTGAAAALASRVVAATAQPFALDEHWVVVGASVGIALAPEHGHSARDLLSHADLALYHSKQTGRGRHTVFEPAIANEADLQRALEVDLRNALELGQFELHYQPIVDAAHAEVVAFEALLRWRHPSRGMVPPMAFIPFAEASGLIVPIGAWALKQACRDAMTWPSNICVSVNLSAVQVHAGGIAETVAMTLAETGLSAKRLELEVTETLQLGDQPSAREQLLRLKSLGVRIALDDFGTGYASLSYLQRFPFDKLKIDRMFIADIADSRASLAIVEAVTSLARTLDMVTVAEGIETGEHLDRARAAGCVLLQGYLFSRPVPAHEVAALIGRHTQPKLTIAAA